MVKNLELWNDKSKDRLDKRFNRLLYTESNAVAKWNYTRVKQELKKAYSLTEYELGVLNSQLRSYDRPRYSTFKGETWSGVLMSFDVKVSNIVKANGTKYGLMYSWQCSLGGIVYYGRDWDSARDFLDFVSEHLGNLKILCLVNSLSYEFQFMRKEFKLDKTFAKGQRDVLDCNYKNIHFKDTLSLFNRGLSTIREAREFNFNKIRHQDTKLSNKELRYIKKSCLELNNLARAELCTKSIKQFLRVKTAPSRIKKELTETYRMLRVAMARKMLNNPDTIKILKLIQESKIDEETYDMLKDAYWGGYNHTGIRSLYEKITDVYSFDITSAYIAAICSKTYPYGKPVNITSNYVDENINLVVKSLSKNNIDYKYLVDVTLYDVVLKCGKGDNILADVNIKEVVNGFSRDKHLVQADKIRVICTLEDLEGILLFYKVGSSSRFNKILRWEAHYLPAFIIAKCLELFNEKQKLKGDKKRRAEYEIIKTLVCCIYGLLGTDPLRDTYDFDEEGNATKKTKKTKQQLLDAYNNRYTRYGYYGWACWISSYVRTVIVHFINALGTDFCYADTDSTKFTNKEKHLHLFTEYNQLVTDEINAVLDKYKIDRRLAQGGGKPLGWFLDETEYKIKDGVLTGGPYKIFKSLGCKRYAYVQDDIVHFTCAGIKEECLQDFLYDYTYDIKSQKLIWLYEMQKGRKVLITPRLKSLDKIINDFDIGLEVPAEYSGCIAAYYNDNETEDEVTDWQGVTAKVKVKSSICLFYTSFTLGSSSEKAIEAFKEGLSYEWEE